MGCCSYTLLHWVAGAACANTSSSAAAAAVLLLLQVQRYLLSNLRYWLDEFQFDGFRWGHSCCCC